MNPYELKLECVRIASENLRALISANERPYDAAGMADAVSAQAEKIADYVLTGNLKAAA